MPEQPEQDTGWVPRPHLFTISQAATACGVSRSRIRRLLDAGAFPNAVQKDQPDKGASARVWHIPAPDLRAAGLIPNRERNSPADSGEATGRLLGEQSEQVAAHELAALRTELDLERERRRAAEALAAERAANLDDLRMALRLLEAHNPRGPAPLPDPPAARQSAPVEPVSEPSSKDAGKPGATWWGRLRDRMK